MGSLFSRRPRLPAFEADWEWVDFTAGDDLPRGVKSERSDRKPTHLEAGVLPGLSMAGHFKTEFLCSTIGEVTVVTPEQRSQRMFPQFPSFALQVYGQGSPAALWPQVEKKAEEIYDLALRSCIASMDPGGAVSRLAYLKAEPKLTDLEREQLRFLEEARIFFDCEIPPASPVRLTLKEVLETEVIHLVPELEGHKLRCRVRQPGILFLEESDSINELVELYGIQLAPRESTLKEVEKAEQGFLTAQEQEAALPIDFRTPKMRGSSIQFGEALTIDLERNLIRGLSPGKQRVELKVSQLTRLDIEERRVRGDTKVHHYYYLALSDGVQTMLFTQRFKHYYEGGSVQAELDEERGDAESYLYSLPKTLDFPGAQARNRLLAVMLKPLPELLQR